MQQRHRAHDARLDTQIDRTAVEKIRGLVFLLEVLLEEIAAMIDGVRSETIDGHHAGVLERMIGAVVACANEGNLPVVVDDDRARVTVAFDLAEQIENDVIVLREALLRLGLFEKWILAEDEIRPVLFDAPIVLPSEQTRRFGNIYNACFVEEIRVENTRLDRIGEVRRIEKNIRVVDPSDVFQCVRPRVDLVD